MEAGAEEEASAEATGLTGAIANGNPCSRQEEAIITIPRRAIEQFVFIGIEEVGVQVEQPFEIVPMTQLCRIIMANLEEAFLQRPPPGM